MKTDNVLLAKEISENRNFDYEIIIDFKSGEQKILTNEDLMITGSEISQSAETQSFPLGCAYGKILNLSLANGDDRWSEYDFFNADIRVFIKYTMPNGSVETLYMGEYYVTEPETYGSTVSITGIDLMCVADIPYTPTIEKGTLRAVLLDALSKCGLSLSNNHFKNEDFVVTNIPKDRTVRNIIGMVAMLAGGNAFIDDTDGLRNRIKIISYNMDAIGSEIIDGGNFHNYGNLPIYDGGDFTFSETDNISGGTFNEQKAYHVLYKAPNVTVCTDDVRITGVTDGTNMVGATGYVLKVQNELIIGNEVAGLTLIYNALHELAFRPFEMDHVSYPLADIGDCCFVVDRKQRVYKSIITDIAFNFKGSTTIKCTAESPIGSSANYTTASTMALQNQANIVRNYDEMSEEIRNASGSYTTVTPANDTTGEIPNAFIVDVFNPDDPDISTKYKYYEPTAETGTYIVYTYSDGEWKQTVAQEISRIVYNHNKRTLELSNVIWRETGTTRSVSTDGGNNWNAAIDASGSVIAQRLNAETVEGVYIKGSDFSNGNGTFHVTKDGTLTATKGTFSGQLVAATGTISDGTGTLSLSGGSLYMSNNKSGGAGVFAEGPNDLYACWGAYNSASRRNGSYRECSTMDIIRAGENASDRRMKKNIINLDSNLAYKLIKNLQPKTFEFKDFPNELNFGFIAQDIRKIENDIGIDTERNRLCYTNEASGMYSVDYTQLIAPLIKVVQDQQNQIDELKSKLNM